LATSRASAPVRSHKAAISFIKESDKARNALIECFVISADAMDIHSIGMAPKGAKIASTCSRVFSQSIPATIRSGERKFVIA
jgi:hypothetical protein